MWNVVNSDEPHVPTTIDIVGGTFGSGGTPRPTNANESGSILRVAIRSPGASWAGKTQLSRDLLPQIQDGPQIGAIESKACPAIFGARRFQRRLMPVQIFQPS